MRTLLASVAVLVVIAVPARADRPVTDAERTNSSLPSRPKVVQAARWNGMKVIENLRLTMPGVTGGSTI